MLNQVEIMGRLTADPEIKRTEGDNIVCNFTVAVARPRSKDKEPQTDFFRCTAWNNRAKIISEYYHKGELIVISGTLRNSEYTKNDEKRVATKIVVKEVHFTGNRKDEQLPPSPEGLEGLNVGSMKDFETVFSDSDAPF